MKPKKKKINKTIIAIIITISSALILSATFFVTYYISTDQTLNHYEKNIKAAANTIHSRNKGTNDLIKDNVIDTKSAKEKLPNIIKDLDDCKKSIDSEIPGDKNKEIQDAIEKGLNNNILMYKQILNILQNPNSKDLNNAITDYENYRDDSESNYAKFNIKGTTLSVLQDSGEFLKSFEAYVNQLIKVQRDADIASSQLLKFASSMDDLVAKFIPLKSDFSIELKKVREKSTTYDDLLNTVSDYRVRCSDLEKDLLKTSIPTNAAALKNSLTKIFDDYDLYIQSLSLAITQEKSEVGAANSNLDESKLKDIYFDASNRYLSIQDKYDAFLKQYTDFKNINIK